MLFIMVLSCIELFYINVITANADLSRRRLMIAGMEKLALLGTLIFGFT